MNLVSIVGTIASVLALYLLMVAHLKPAVHLIHFKIPKTKYHLFLMFKGFSHIENCRYYFDEYENPKEKKRIKRGALQKFDSGIPFRWKLAKIQSPQESEITEAQFIVTDTENTLARSRIYF